MRSTTTADPFALTIESLERTAKIKQALLAMTRREQLVVIAHDRQAKSLGWIAKRLQISQTEAREALTNGRARLAGIPGL